MPPVPGTLEQAWSQLEELLGAMVFAPYNQRFDALDEALAAFVREHPGQLEARMLERVEVLARSPRRDLLSRLRGGFRDTPSPDRPTPLAALWNQAAPGAPGLEPARLAKLYEAVEPLSMLRVFAVAQLRHAASLGFCAQQNSYGLAAFLASRCGPDVLARTGLPPEACDKLRCMVSGEPLPDILPRDLAGLTGAELEQRLEAYTGLPIDAIEERLRPGAISASGFLARGERLAPRILEDAALLARLGVDRADLARRIEQSIEVHWYNVQLGQMPDPEQFERSRGFFEHLLAQHEARRLRLEAQLGLPTGPGGSFALPWDLELLCAAGHQQDPFHATDVYGLTGRGACEFRLNNPQRGPQAVVHGPDLVAVLARRACFFEGSVPCRVDPWQAAWVLELTDREPPSPRSG